MEEGRPGRFEWMYTILTLLNLREWYYLFADPQFTASAIRYILGRANLGQRGYSRRIPLEVSFESGYSDVLLSFILVQDPLDRLNQYILPS